MHARSSQIAFGAAAALILASSLACTSPAPATPPQLPGEAKAAAERVWTKEFQEQSILIAREISIEGPPGLIDHVVLKPLPGQIYLVSTTAAGFLQELSVGEGAANPIWIQLDNLAINAVRRGRVLERIAPGPVRIHAQGDALWKNLVTGQELRGETLDLVGPPAQ